MDERRFVIHSKYKPTGEAIMALFGQRTLPENLASVDGIALCIFLVGFLILGKWKVNPIFVMAGSGVAGVILYALR